jgi:hypothetical protein
MLCSCVWNCSSRVASSRCTHPSNDDVNMPNEMVRNECGGACWRFGPSKKSYVGSRSNTDPKGQRHLATPMYRAPWSGAPHVTACATNHPHACKFTAAMPPRDCPITNSVASRPAPTLRSSWSSDALTRASSTAKLVMPAVSYRGITTAGPSWPMQSRRYHASGRIEFGPTLRPCRSTMKRIGPIHAARAANPCATAAVCKRHIQNPAPCSSVYVSSARAPTVRCG